MKFGSLHTTKAYQEIRITPDDGVGVIQKYITIKGSEPNSEGTKAKGLVGLSVALTWALLVDGGTGYVEREMEEAAKKEAQEEWGRRFREIQKRSK